MRFSYFLDNEKAVSKFGYRKDGQPWPIPPRVKHVGPYGDAGVDLFIPIDLIVPSFSYEVVDTFVGFIFDIGVAGLVVPRGGDRFLVGSGLVDTGYTGTIHVRIVNPYDEPIAFKRGDSIGQLVPFVKAHPDGIELHSVPVPSTSVSQRGKTGRIVAEAAGNV